MAGQKFNNDTNDKININETMHTLQSKAKNIGLICLVCNFLLALAKLAVGYAAASSAMIADGFNSAGDCFTSIAMLMGQHISSKPRDEDHPQGHGKAEYIFSGIIALALIIVALTTFKNSVLSIIEPKEISHFPILLIVAAITIVTKIFISIYADKIGKLSKNPLVIAIAADQKADIFLTLGTAIGIIGSQFGLKFLDGALGVLISIFIAKSGFTLLLSSYRVLMDTAESDNSPIVKLAQNIIESKPEVDHIDSITARPVGTQYALSIKISVPGDMSVLESHSVTRQIKDPLMENPDVADVIIHVNALEEHKGPSTL